VGHNRQVAQPVAERRYLLRFVYLSIAAAVLTLLLKYAAYVITGSVGLLSDAIESIVNVVAAVIALIALRSAAKPADSLHHFGRGKAEYLSSGIEGFMIFGAATAILVTSVPRLWNPGELEDLGFGLLITSAATVVNAVVGIVLVRVGTTHRSATLRADGHHLLTDVWTSVGVIVGVTLVLVTGWTVLDPLVAIAVAINIMVVGVRLVRESTRGLLDVALPEAETRKIVTVLAAHAVNGVTFHGLQTREAGRDRFMSVHMLVPGQWSISEGHDAAERVEQDLREAVPDLAILTHLEPREDPRAYGDYSGGVEITDAMDPRDPADGAGG
jgi:cation diffusion facilitator family transporter